MPPRSGDTRLTFGLAPPTDPDDDHGLVVLPCGRPGESVDQVDQEAARGVREAEIITAQGRIALSVHRIIWSWKLAHETDHDHLTVFAPRDGGPLALPQSYLVRWAAGARALFLLDHYGQLAARWGDEDLQLQGLSYRDDGPVGPWVILDAAIRAGTDVEWSEGVLVKPLLDR